MITKRFGTYVSPRNLRLYLGKTLFLMKIVFILGKNHVTREKEFKLPLGNNLNILFLEKQSWSLRKKNLNCPR
jgi:hypothetical protein